MDNLQLLLVICLFKETMCSSSDLVEKYVGVYLEEERPVCEGNDTSVHMDLSLRQIITLDDTAEVLTSNVWVRLNWTDCRLTWNSTRFNGTDVIYVSADHVWTPDLTLYDDTTYGNSVGMSERKFYKLSVTSEGRVSQTFPSVLNSICDVDTTYFPFDRQNCPLQFGLWVHDDSTVVLTSHEEGDTAYYMENAEWDLLGVDVGRKPYIYNNKQYSSITYTLNLRRRPAFFMLTLCFPCFLICSISVLGFFLPSASGEKLALEVSLLLSLSVFLFLTQDTLPPNSKPLPLICVYFVLVMVLSSTSCVLAVAVLKVHMKGQQGWKVPPRVRTLIIDKLGRLLLIKRPHILREDAQEEGKIQLENVLHSDEENAQPAATSAQVTDTATTTAAATSQAPAPATSQAPAPEKDAQVSAEAKDWLTIAVVLDRLFLILYALLSVTVFVAFLIQFTL
ncbi:neuronal acetylcholine receptor subunit beta-3-like [Haliotis rubra]|uniref:neuronal acetylcholine receptor subunit beta-3-like n=1 Tax=Haliotis rubra TaxID=36100 RepID=UPI001EE5794E|nr:neuronal acetylcholine receptor subunit beta-3-like [Haliotis rubra]